MKTNLQNCVKSVERLFTIVDKKIKNMITKSINFVFEHMN